MLSSRGKKQSASLKILEHAAKMEKYVLGVRGGASLFSQPWFGTSSSLLSTIHVGRTLFSAASPHRMEHANVH